MPENTGFQIKVAILSNGNMVIRIPREEETCRLVRQICNKNWKTASKTILEHFEMRDEVKAKIMQLVSKELANYVKQVGSLLLRNPDELIGFSNVILFLEELRVYCPMFFAILVASASL